MSRRNSTATLLVAVAVFAQAADGPPTFTITGPTIVAFFQPLTDADLEKDAGLNETLADFQLYAGESRTALQKAGVRLETIYARAFKIIVGGKTTIVTPKIPVGYYFVAPAKKPRVEYGVRTTGDLLNISMQYFGK